jgi:hypothetical protein
MAYDARRGEVQAALMQAGFDSAQLEIINRVLERYFAQREGYLRNLLEVLPPGRSDPAHPAWLERAKAAMGMTNETFNTAGAGFLWLARLVNEEHTFFYQIHMSQAPVLRDKMMKQRAALEQAMKEFREKWERIRSADKDVDDKLRKAAEQYGEILDAAAKVAAQAEKETKEKVADGIKLAVTGGVALVDFGLIGYAIKGAAALLGIKVSEVQARKQEIFALISLENTVVATFKESREIVTEFLRDNNYSELKDTWDAADDAAEALEGAMLTDGQKRDGAEFGKAIKEELARVFGAAETAYKDFAREHEYLFFGPLGASYNMELAEDDTWKQFSENWKNRREDFDDLLQDRVFEPNPERLVEISLEGLSSDDKQRIYSLLESSLRELLRAWNQVKETTKDPYWALESREALKRVLDAMR